MPRLPQLRFNERLQLMMLIEPNVLARTGTRVEQAHGMSEAPGFPRDKARSIALSLAETVELLVLGRCTPVTGFPAAHDRQGDVERPQANVHFVAPFIGDAVASPKVCSHAIR